jgi:hypothetical protein
MDSPKQWSTFFDARPMPKPSDVVVAPGVTTRRSHAVAAEWTVELWRGLRRSS